MSRNIIPTYSLLSLILMSLCFVLTNADVECTDVMSNLSPCQGFLMKGDESPSVACCSGAQAVDKQFQDSDKPDRESICLCLNNALKKLPIDPMKAADLPFLCNLIMDPNIDCPE
ncbi:hypothetical protein KY290_028210 [Solanum tuberosum]|uniref:Non-specific lipid-transfer protein n=1 Tax=Solanum tuberosum TaxID=4113 RepID=A0ABQ7UIF6_SOLTU|nr:hypothetical protein KY290_028210 [Solanum tuberosum]